MDVYFLTDGTEVEIRPIRRDDGERLRAAHERLSPESRYRRFLGAKPTLTSSDAAYLVDVDGCDHFALVATAPVDGDEGSIIGVGRFIRLAEDPAAAEFAIVVGDEHQRQGLATALLARLVVAAMDRGVFSFRATILTENVAIYRLLEHLSGGQLRSVRRGSVSEIEVTLPSSPGDAQIISIREGARARSARTPASGTSRARAKIAAWAGG